MYKCVAVVGVVLAFSSPASAGKKASLDVLRKENYEAVVSTNDQTPRFTYHAPKGLNASHFIGGAVGVVKHASAANEGSRILSEFGISEPSIDIAKAIAETLGSELQLPADFQDGGLASSLAATHATLRSPEDLAGAYGPGKLVINVGTFMWSLQGTGESKFRLIYAARANLVDTSRSVVVASADCSFPLKRGDAARDAKTMLDADAASLKAEFLEVTDFCNRRLKSEMLGIQSP